MTRPPNPPFEPPCGRGFDSGFGNWHGNAIEPEHTVAVEDLPAHHNNPFERILVAQALIEPMRLMTHNALIALYSDTIIKI